jgi:cell division protein ZipA
MAPAGRPLNGERLQTALEAEGLRHGDMNIFHFHQAGEKDAVFSVANVVEPGVFDLATMAELETPGITLFCQLPGPLEGADAFDIMLDKARSLATSLDGHVCDDRRNALTTQAVSHYHDRIETFSRELALARKKAAEK